MKEKKMSVAKGILFTVLTLLLATVLTEFGIEFGEMAFSPLTARGGDGIQFVVMYASFIGVWVLVLLVSLIGKENRKLFAALKFKKSRVKKSVCLGLIAGIGVNLLVGLVAMAHGDIQLSFNSFNPAMLLLFLLVVVIQSGAEELVTRWFIYQRVKRYFPNCPAVAILANALLFGVLHLANPGVTLLSVLNICVVGILYSLMVHYFDSFWGAVIAHTTWNYCQSILLGLPNSGIVSKYSLFKLNAASAANSFTYNVGFGIEGTILTVVLLSILMAALFCFGRKYKAMKFAAA